PVLRSARVLAGPRRPQARHQSPFHLHRRWSGHQGREDAERRQHGGRGSHDRGGLGDPCAGELAGEGAAESPANAAIAGQRSAAMRSLRNRGSLLLEHLVAMALLGLLAVSVFSLLSTGSRAAQIAKEARLAGSLAAQKLEELTARCDDAT